MKLGKSNLIAATLSFTRALGEQPIIIGSGAMVLNGFMAQANDIDIAVTHHLSTVIRKRYPIEVKWDYANNRPSEYYAFKLNPMDPYKFDVGPYWTALSVATGTVEENGVRFLTPQELLRFYTTLNREKDKAKIAFLQKRVLG